MVTWPSRAFAALRALFEPLQDIDVYVEDENDEVFYTHLLSRVMRGEVRIARVFSKTGRDSVVRAAESHDQKQRRALFVIDGDFDWVVGSPAPTIPGLFRIDAYCVENLLVNEAAAICLLMQDASMTEEVARECLMFSEWIGRIEPSLVRLFAAFAVAHVSGAEHATVSLGVGRLCTHGGKGRSPELDERKVEEARLAALSAATLIEGDVAFEMQEQICARAFDLAMPLDIVSGKDFLLPLLDFRLQSFGCRIPRKPLRNRLALACDLGRLSGLRDAMILAARGAF